MSLPDPNTSYHADLTGRVVLITGATGGLGHVLVHACAAAGATVVMHGRVVRKLEALYDGVVTGGYPEPIILPLDLLQAGANDFSVAESALRAQLGRLDAIVHTAAFLGSLGPIEHQSLDRWLDAWRVNVAGAMGLTRALLPLLDAAPDASVVFTLDSRGQAPRAYWGAYAATKAGLAALAATLADEWEHRANLRINAVVPGPMHSPMRMLTHPGEDKSELPKPERFIPLYLYLIRGQAKAASALCVDGAAWLGGQPAATTLLPAGRDVVATSSPPPSRP